MKFRLDASDVFRLAERLEEDGDRDEGLRAAFIEVFSARDQSSPASHRTGRTAQRRWSPASARRRSRGVG